MTEPHSAGLILRLRKEENNLFLILKSKWDKNWSFPKGRVSKNESPFIAAMRELKAETGLESEDLILENISFVDVKQNLKKQTKLDGVKKIRFFFGFLPRVPSIVLSREHVKFKFCSLALLDDLMDKCFVDVLRDTIIQKEMEKQSWIHELYAKSRS